MRHIFENHTDAEGSRRYCAAYLNQDGALVIETHDMGPIVERFYGAGNDEYEAFETFTLEQTQRLREDLGEDLIAKIAERFESSAQLTAHIQAIGLERGSVWNRIGS